MTFLPIVGRELRTAARRSGTYWMRLWVALQATVAAGGGVADRICQSADQIWRGAFLGAGGSAMLHCLLAGRRSTADCLSQEKREGTMGLLFLTDLKGYDVVIGKLVATSLGGFYGLFAIFPVLAVPLLVAGMTDGEFWRMVLALTVTSSSRCRSACFARREAGEYKEAMGRNFLVLTSLTILPRWWDCLFSPGKCGWSRFFSWRARSTPSACARTVCITVTPRRREGWSGPILSIIGCAWR